MGLYIRDDSVDLLARQLQTAIDAPTKTEAVRIALQHELERARKAVPLGERIRKHQEAFKALGPVAKDFDLKKYMDEGWDGL